MKANSLVVGYDADGLPQKVYWSFDNGKKRQSFEYYLKTEIFYCTIFDGSIESGWRNGGYTDLSCATDVVFGWRADYPRRETGRQTA